MGYLNPNTAPPPPTPVLIYVCVCVGGGGGLPHCFFPFLQKKKIHTRGRGILVHSYITDLSDNQAKKKTILIQKWGI